MCTRALSPSPVTGLLASLCFAAAATAQPQYNVQYLPGLVPNAGLTDAQSINNNGVVVGGSSMSSVGLPDAFRSRAVRWDNGMRLELPDLPNADPLGIQGGARGVNDAGVVVGLSRFDSDGSGLGGRAVRSDGTTPTDLGLPAGDVLCQATLINNSGLIAGFSVSGLAFGASYTALRWNGVTPEPLERLPTHTSSLAMGLNNSGRIVGYSAESEVSVRASTPVYWDTLAPTVLPLLPGDRFGFAAAINDAGLIVGQSTGYDEMSMAYTSARPVVWNPAGGGMPMELPLLPGTAAGTAQKVNASGQILGACGAIDAAAFDFFGTTLTLWDGPNVYDLSAILTTLFPQDALIIVTDMNDAGQLVGTVQLTDPDTFEFYGLAFVATPIPNPSGAVIALTFGGLLVLMGGRRRT